MRTDDKVQEAGETQRWHGQGVQMTWPPTSSVFVRLDAAARAESVALRLDQSIRLGLLPDGERLPTEVDLARQFGVSTVTLREALAVVRRAGLLVTRRGRGGGTFVRAPAHQSRGWLMDRLREYTLEELRDLGDFRAAVESGAAALAAHRASTDEQAQLGQRLAQLGTATSLDARRKADGRFRIELAAAAQSARLTRIVIAIQAEVGNLVWLPFELQNDITPRLATRGNLMDAIKRRDASAASDTVQELIGHETAALIQLRLTLVEAKQ